MPKNGNWREAMGASNTGQRISNALKNEIENKLSTKLYNIMIPEISNSLHISQETAYPLIAVLIENLYDSGRSISGNKIFQRAFHEISLSLIHI